MSEYQYYEFAAIDQPLTRTDMAKLRAVSTRAEITPAGFVNQYEWGDLKADPSDWMRRYFDAFVYTANWCSCRLALRVPLTTFKRSELKPFATQHTLRIEASDEHWIIDWSLDESEDYDRFGVEDGHGWMRRLVPLRDYLLRGDLRPVYLGGLLLPLEANSAMAHWNRKCHLACRNCPFHCRHWSNSWRSIPTYWLPPRQAVPKFHRAIRNKRIAWMHG